MKRRFDDYTRLARGLFGASSLWLGPTDLLSVRGSGVLLPFVEEYCRFELERVQSAAVIKTRTGLVLNLIYGGLVLLLGGMGGAAVWQGMTGGGQAEPFFYVLAVPLLLLATVALLLFIINLALGPTCRFQIQTATRVERIRAVRRLRPARRLLTRLTPVLLAAQGPGIGGQRSEVGGQRSALSGQKTEISGQKSEVGGQRSAVRDQPDPTDPTDPTDLTPDS